MKKISVKAYFILLLLFFMPLCLIAQQGGYSDWEILMFQDDADFNEIVNQFNQKWANKPYVKGAGIKPFRRWEWFHETRLDDQGRMARNQHLDNWIRWQSSYNPEPATGNRNLTCPISGSGDWISQGPNNTVDFYGIGRVNYIAFHPVNSNELWAASPSGGMWVSHDYGSSWSTFTDDFATLAFSDIAFNPSDPNTIYAATGDNDHGDAPSIGVLKSTDGGVNWNVVYSTASRIHRILINPNDTNVILAATSSGLFRSVNAGNTWTEVIDAYIRHMEFKPNNPNTIYATEYANNARCYRSINGGSTWSQITLPSVSNTPRRLAIGVSPANSDIVYLSGGYNDPGGSNDFSVLYKSTNSGASYTTVPGVPTLGSQYWYDWTIVVDPTDTDVIFTGGVGLDKTENGGVDWSNNGSGVHVDHHFAGYHPITGDLFVASDGGIYYSDDNGSSWNFVSEGLGITQYYRLSTSDTEGDLIIGGSQDNGSHLLDDDDWDRVSGADGMECIIQPSDEHIIYATYQYGTIRKSTDKGQSISTVFSAGQAGESGAWVTPYAMDPSNPNILYAGYESAWKTTDAGTNWSNMSGDFGAGTLKSIAISEDDPNYVYVGTYSSLWGTTNGGSNWSALNTPSGSIRYLFVDSKDKNTILAASSNDVYRSTNGGGNWTNISGGLPSIPMNCIVMQKGPHNPMYVGTDFGVYYNDDNLADWILFSTGLPNVVVLELEIDECQGMIRAATFGRGVWESPLYCNEVGTICCGDLMPKISPASGSVLECASSAILMAVPGPNDYSIQWYKDGSMIPGANNLEYIAEEGGLYTYKLINPTNSSCNSLMSSAVDVFLNCIADSACAPFSANTDNGPGNTTVISIVGSWDDIPSNEVASVCIKVDGDVGWANVEVFNIYDEGGVLQGVTESGSDCGGPTAEVCFSISSSNFNQWNNDNTIVVTLDPISTAINPVLCTVNEACARLFLPFDELDPCPPADSLNLTGIIPTGIYRAVDKINADGKVLMGSNVELNAVNAIELDEDFEVENNATFEAKTEPCLTGPVAPGPSTSRKSSDQKKLQKAVLLLKSKDLDSAIKK